eukprot:COSAG04_NODE_1613_length_6165_cov_3.524069_6_plen_61_part_00
MTSELGAWAGWGDSPPSHTITAHSPELTVDAEVAYAGALVCATVSNTSASGALPWYELRT